tara:strand:+ start:26397 stop:28055 length:1659 start_codon:yes stop_codon:yes gene_type:complete
MLKAHNNLVANGTFRANRFIIRTTHNYVVFKPNNIEDEGILQQDTTLIYFDYPLDHEILKGGSYYKDPLLTKEQLNFKYTCIPSAHSIPNVNHEVLESLYIPEEVEAFNDNPDVDKLVSEALRITNNLTEQLLGIRFGRPSRWNPSGTIRVYDDHINNYIPLEGAKLITTRWFVSKYTYTDANGYYRINDSYRRPVNYQIKWERNDYDIRSGTIGQAILSGPKQKQQWNKDIDSELQKYYAHIHRAAFDYYHNHNKVGLKSPPKKEGLRPRLKIAAYDEYDSADLANHKEERRFLGIGNTIKMRVRGEDSDFVYGVAIHEIGHYSHWGITRSDFDNTNKEVKESWAEAVELSITTWRYKQLDPWYIHQNNYQNRRRKLNDRDYTYNYYTPIFIDLMDIKNQSSTGPIDLHTPCPCGGDFDSKNCFIATAPEGSTPFIYDTENSTVNNGNFYYTPINGNQCPLPGSYYDGNNCFVQTIPNNCIPFIHNNSFYIIRNGDSEYQIDEVSEYTLQQLENTLPLVKNFDDLENELRIRHNNPSEKYLDELFQYYDYL